MTTTTTARAKKPAPPRGVQEIPVAHLNELSSALTAFRNGDFSVRLGRRDGALGDVVDRFNEVADMQERRTRELVRVSHVIGREGRMTERLSELNDKGDWASSATAVNSMIDDLVQETLISVHSKRQSFDPSRPYLPWLAAIARYRWVDALRRMRDTDELHPEEVASEEDDSPIVARLSISRLLSHLPARQANVIVLTRIEGRSVAEAAQICGQSENLVKVNVHRGLKKLAALVESE